MQLTRAYGHALGVKLLGGKKNIDKSRTWNGVFIGRIKFCFIEIANYLLDGIVDSFFFKQIYI